ncbi:MAG: tryptophan-rich sensory protein [Ruminococcaceae bacterium]|nr:tryptophan-rich sensory protein [Oscillospiraceae bacterium]
MKIRWKTLLICIAIPLLVGLISGLISRGGMEIFETVSKPPLSPPGFLFPIVWTILYILMGISSYLVLSSGASKGEVANALSTYGIQLFFNFFWSIIFFNLELYTFAFVWLAALWIFILLTIIRFSKISKPAAYLMIPYILWVSFAGYLNLGIAILN